MTGRRIGLTSVVCVLAGSLLGLTPAQAAVHVTLPPVNGRFDYQIGGSYAPAAGVRIVDRDRQSSPANGIYSICYVNAFQTQPEEASWWRRLHPSLLLRDSAGHPVEDPDWPGEFMLDTSTATKRSALLKVVGSWLDGCAHKGFRAVEPDNLDSWTRSKGLLTKADNLAFAESLVRRGHHDGLAVAQKNTTELGSAGRRTARFDFAIAEECQVYAECGAYTSVYGRHVIEIEYTDNARAYYLKACTVRGNRISIILRDRDVVPRGDPAYRYQAC
jgi:Glycoside-hydrolase family GH114